MSSSNNHSSTTARARLLIALLVGLMIGTACILVGAARFAPLVAWDVIVLVYVVSVWLTVWPMSASETESHALRENPGRTLADATLLFASVASIAAVIVLLVDAASSHGVTKIADIAIGLASIVLSWVLVHTVFMLKYASLYYGKPRGGVNFNQNDLPRYQDFAYLAFTLGMTFQVSDTDLVSKELRVTALKHALLAYLFGTIIIATTINTLASLSK